MWIENPNNDTLKQIYSESLALLYVSRYEGFGMPLIEAMSLGCVPIAGRHSSIPEVLGDAGIMVNIEEPTEISRAMLKCLNNPQFLTKIVKLGLSRSQKFSWRKSAQETLSFYERL